MKNPKHILVLTYWKFDDALIQTYTLPYVRIIRDLLPEGSTIHLVTLENDPSENNNVEIERGIIHVTFPLHPFGLKAILGWRKNIRTLVGLIKDKNISKIHTWCTPAGGIGWQLSKKTGIPLVLDSYEPHAEPMVETGTWKKNGIAFKVLFRLERKQTHHAEWIIGVTPLMKMYAQKKFGYQGDNFLVKPACINLDQFDLREQKREDLLAETGLKNKIVCVYAGKFGGLYLTSEAFRFFRIAHEYWGDSFRVLLMSNTSRAEIEAYCKSENFDPAIIISRFVPHSQMGAYLGLGDFAFSAFKPVPSRLYCTPIKNGEYWAMGLPVVIPADISTDSAIIASNDAGYVLQSISDVEMKKSVEYIDQLLKKETIEQRSQRIRQLAEKHRNFAIAYEVYRKIYLA